MNGWDKYILTVRKLERRYSRNGKLTVSIGGIMTKFAALDYMAWRKYVLAVPQV